MYGALYSAMFCCKDNVQLYLKYCLCDTAWWYLVMDKAWVLIAIGREPGSGIPSCFAHHCKYADDTLYQTAETCPVCKNLLLQFKLHILIDLSGGWQKHIWSTGNWPRQSSLLVKYLLMHHTYVVSQIQRLNFTSSPSLKQAQLFSPGMNCILTPDIFSPHFPE